MIDKILHLPGGKRGMGRVNPRRIGKGTSKRALRVAVVGPLLALWGFAHVKDRPVQSPSGEFGDGGNPKQHCG
jgi:hypothetical protein